ncbi:MAG: SIMPL domain-containing protein [Chloroflexota bacterium]
MLKRYRNFLYLANLLVLAALMVACNPTAAQPAAAQADERDGGITVVGEGEAFGQPDRADIQIGVETFDEDVAEATNQNEADVENIMSALEELDIATDDIQTSNYSLWAEQRHGDEGPEGITGYRVSNVVNVTIRDIDAVGEVIGAVTAAGANNIHGITFSVADPAALEEEAREAAISNAREKAASLAELSGVELGDVVAVSEVIGQPGPLMEGMGGRAAAQDEAAASPSISPGELGYSVQVQVTFDIP